MLDLREKNILMFSPYGATKHYGEAIKKELIERGAVVFGYDERPSQNGLVKIVIRLFKKKIPQIFDKYINHVIKENEYNCIDYILICRGEAFTPYTIKHLKRSFPKAKVLLYLWDVMHECPMKDALNICDRAMSFDPEDVANNDKLEFRPTFFVDDYKNVKTESKFKYDVCFIGTLYAPRHKIIKSLIRSFDNQGIKAYMYLYVPGILMYIKELICHFPFMGISKVQFKPLDLGTTISILDECKCILDLNPPYQKSLSTRAHEAMAARRKYITTNSEILKYEHYHPDNILVIDINSPIIPKGFLEKPFHVMPDNILYKYSVKGLVDDLFDGL
jgi:hypothetical protein